MIGLDTYVVIRYLVQDDRKESVIATQIIEKSLTSEEPGYINQITLCEIAWVLQRSYGITKPQLLTIIEGLITTKQFLVENVEAAWKALRAFNDNNADFCDALIAQVNIYSGCVHTVTFDKKAGSLPGFELLSWQTA